jgi:hypothetical protein
LAGLPSRLRRRPSIAPATSRTARNAWDGDKSPAGYEYYVNSACAGRHNIRYRCRSRSP